eukprot:3334116-Rhodomonas_salina.1
MRSLSWLPVLLSASLHASLSLLAPFATLSFTSFTRPKPGFLLLWVPRPASCAHQPTILHTPRIASFALCTHRSLPRTPGTNVFVLCSQVDIFHPPSIVISAVLIDRGSPTRLFDNRAGIKCRTHCGLRARNDDNGNLDRCAMSFNGKLTMMRMLK